MCLSIVYCSFYKNNKKEKIPKSPISLLCYHSSFLSHFFFLQFFP
uniref:Uncharacterized protein n=1 Tax=Rhizophora mucronata TaxID=61149 RepID=A0A2P2R5F8_RHIMU